ncbi:MAG: hypothetical protein LUG93_16880 [Lachnospiraceae bacterium]|nr:hypothetical protein [Lachnospiraceae bacterium]
MTPPVLELERETIVRLQKEIEDLRMESITLRLKKLELMLERIILLQERETLRAAKSPLYRWQRRLKRKANKNQ